MSLSSLLSRFSKQKHIEIPSNLFTKNLETEDLEKFKNFLLNLRENERSGIIEFLEKLKKEFTTRKIFLLIQDNELFIYIFFDENERNIVDEEINRAYDILDDIKEDLWFVNIGETFYESWSF